MPEIVLQAEHIKKVFKVGSSHVNAVNGLDMTVYRGEIFGFLGPNGAGKTTSLRMLATLLGIDAGRATIAGEDVKDQPANVRTHIGYVSQLGGSDNEATGRSDLVLQGRLYGMSKKDADIRAAQLIKDLQLSDFVNRKVSTYSGGQKRRLDVALGIVHRPDLLFLDEPTTGLDPQNRANLWEQVRLLRDNGTTVFLTTHYMDEVDALCDRLAIMDNGTIIALGTPQELKERLAGDAIIFTLASGHTTNVLVIADKVRRASLGHEVVVTGKTIRLYTTNGPGTMPKLFQLLQDHDISIAEISMTRASLDDVFLKLTGRSLRDNSTKGETV